MSAQSSTCASQPADYPAHLMSLCGDVGRVGASQPGSVDRISDVPLQMVTTCWSHDARYPPICANGGSVRVKTLAIQIWPFCMAWLAGL
jgi:hypothetical protein